MKVEQVRDRLLEQLVQQGAVWRRFNAYYDGDHPLPDAPPGARNEFLRLMRLSRSNWMSLIVDAVAERLTVDGFRFGDAAEADIDVWRTIWQPNQLDAEHASVHTEALIGGVAGVLVWPAADMQSTPTITAEHPTELYIDHEPGGARQVRAAIKMYRDGTVDYCTMWTAAVDGARPAMVYKWSRDEGQSDWVPWAAPGDPGPEFENLLGVVPAVSFANRTRMLGPGRSELAGGITDIQDRINETLFARVTSTRYAAFRQRWATGLDIPIDPETGTAIEPFKSAIDRLWVAENKDVKFGEFDQTDLSPLIKASESDIQHLAAISRTPPHYLLGQSGAFPSGESLKATETGLVAKVRLRQLRFGESWEQVARLGLRAMGDQRHTDKALEVIWRDPESKGLGELVDSLVKLKGLNVPDEALWERYGASQVEIARWRQKAARATLAAAAAKPAATPVPGAPPAADALVAAG